MKTWLYSWVFYPIFLIVAKLLGLFNSKIRKTMELRSWRDFLSLRYNRNYKIEYWIHVASSGELEYAIPVIEELKRRNINVLVTYYSISAKVPVEKLPEQYSNVSLVVPLPHDGLGLMKAFIRLIKDFGISKLLLLKYELWPGMLWECNRLRIKVFLIDALKPSWFHAKLIHKLSGILAGYDSELLGVNHKMKEVVGDTRVKRVVDRLQVEKHIFDIPFEEYLKSNSTIVCGSVWPQDSTLIYNALIILNKKHIKLPNILWVPHEIDEVETLKNKKQFEELGYITLTYDEMISKKYNLDFTNEKPIALLINIKGILVELYKLGNLSYVGGGLAQGLHSVWEPALSGSLIACGPKLDRSPEGKVLLNINLLKVTVNAEDLAEWIVNNKNSNKMEMYKRMSHVIQQHINASSRIVDLCNQ